MKTWAPAWFVKCQQDQRRRRDGTTTATVMAEAIFNEGLKAVVAGVNPIQMKSGIEKAVPISPTNCTR